MAVVSQEIASEAKSDPLVNVDGPSLYLHGSDENLDGYEDRDARELARLGKKQVLRRNFGFWTMLGLSLSCTVTWEGIMIVFLFALENGGTSGVVYEYIFTWLGYLCAVASLAELASIAPIAGGQYHWVYMLSGPKWRNLLSYITGWHSVLCWQAASGAYLSGTIIQGLLVLNYPSYDPKNWHGTMLMYAVLVAPVAVNVIFARWLPKVEGVVLFLHLAMFPAILIPLLVLGPKGTTSDVFSTIEHGGGYASTGLTFLVGAVGNVFAFLGADAACHMSEESSNASRNVPLVMVGTLLVNGTLGFASVLVIVFRIGNVSKAISTKTGYPFIEIFRQAVHSINGATAMASFILAIAIFATMSILAAGSRMTWAFARDKGLPGSRWLGRVDPSTKLPLYAIGLTIFITVALAPINIGSSEAFNALVSLAVSGSLGSFVVPLALTLYRRIKEPGVIKPGRFNLGWLGLPTNIIGLSWAIIAMFFSFWPSAVPVQSVVGMNWSCLIYGVMVLFAAGFYILHARHHYHGPIVETELKTEQTK